MSKRYRYDLSEEENALLDRYRKILGLKSLTEALRVLIHSYIPIAISTHQKALNSLGTDQVVDSLPDPLPVPLPAPKPTEPKPIEPKTIEPPKPEAFYKPSLPVQADQVFGDLMRRLQ